MQANKAKNDCHDEHSGFGIVGVVDVDCIKFVFKNDGCQNR